VTCAIRACELNAFACAAINISSGLNCEFEFPVLPVVVDPAPDVPVADEAVVEAPVVDVPVVDDAAPAEEFELAVGAVVSVTVVPSE
jgi:hypothetical protein